jgi:hypothetical protein
VAEKRKVNVMPNQFPMSFHEFVTTNQITPIHRAVLETHPDCEHPDVMKTENEWKEMLDKLLKQPA